MTYLELTNVHLDYEVDHPEVMLNGVWLEKDGKELDITDFLTKADWQVAEQQAIEDYNRKCEDAADRAEAMAEARAEAMYERRQEAKYAHE